MNFLDVSLKNVRPLKKNSSKISIDRYVFFLLASFLLVLSGCSSRPPAVVSTPQQTTSYAKVSMLLEEHLDVWAGTPYKLGGISTRGIDCSGFVARTYLDLFGVRLPRTAIEQARSGLVVGRANMRPGDLVVFKTGFTDHHIGIYVGGNEFIHASSSIGVTKSRLDNPYWVKKSMKVVRPTELSARI